MTNGTIMDKLITFSLPLMLSGILQLMFNAVDIIVVGQFSGSRPLAAVGSTSALINVFTNFFIGISLGTNVLAARFFASGKIKEMSDTVHTSILFAAISGVVMMIVGLLFSRFALELMETPDEVIDMAALYLKIYFVGVPFFMLYNYGAAVLRAVGDTRRPLVFLVISGAVNAILNVILVVVFHLDVEGVAIATVISQMISCVLVLRCLCKTDAGYQLHFSKLSINGKYLRQIFQVGVMAGYTAANNLLGFLYTSINAVTQACMSFTSQNYGVKKTKRMDRVLVDCIILSILIATVMGGAFYVFGPQILSVYNKEPDVIKSGMEILSFTTLTYFLCGIMDLFPGAMRGMGRSGVPMILSIIGTVGTRIFWIYVIFPRNRALDVLFISYPVSWGLTIVMQVCCFIIVRRKVHREIQ